MTWFDLCGKFYARTFPQDGILSSLPHEWERELAALWRLEADVNNGAYLQFLANWGRESYEYASRALRKMGADRMAYLVDTCQALVDEHVAGREISYGDLHQVLPARVIERIHELSCEFTEYPENLAQLGWSYYRSHIDADQADG